MSFGCPLNVLRLIRNCLRPASLKRCSDRVGPRMRARCGLGDLQPVRGLALKRCTIREDFFSRDEDVSSPTTQLYMVTADEYIWQGAYEPQCRIKWRQIEVAWKGSGESGAWRNQHVCRRLIKQQPLAPPQLSRRPAPLFSPLQMGALTADCISGCKTIAFLGTDAKTRSTMTGECF